MPGLNAFDEELLELFGDQDSYDFVRSKITEETDEECPHSERSESDGSTFVCRMCGCEVEMLDFKPEWRFYGAADNRVSKDPSRCHRSKENTRGGIDKVFQDAKLGHLPLSIRKKTEQKYKIIVGDETVRGKGRKAIVAACLLFTFRHNGDVRTSDEVRNMFDLSKQEMSDGLTRYLEKFPKDRIEDIKPADLIERVMRLTKVGLEHYKYVLRIAKCLDGVDATLNRSSPQSVASAILYLYICLTPNVREELGLTKTKFARGVGLSEITVSKLVKKAADVIGAKVDV